jgi:ribosomal protein S6--L-glutamate ligase
VPSALVRPAGEPLVAVVGWPQQTNCALVEAWRALGVRAALLEPRAALDTLRPGDTAVGRLDVVRTLDGVEPGLASLAELARRGVRVVNSEDALLNAHDKLRTARIVQGAGLPHPRTAHLETSGRLPDLAPPLVVKPRFGSWGIDVFRCRTEEGLVHVLSEIESRPWYVAQGALVQELVTAAAGVDLRVVVAAGEVVGAVERVARSGEWRTNVSLGASRHPVEPPRAARALSLRAADAIGAELVGVDLLPAEAGYVVLELNGAVEFDSTYDLPDGRTGVYEATARALGLPRTVWMAPDAAAAPSGG